MDKTGLYYQNHPDPDFPGPTSSGIRHWRQKVIRAGDKIFYRFYPAFADYTQPRSIRNRISRESQKVWNDHTRKESCRFLFLNNFHDGDLFVTLTFRDEPADMTTILNRKHYFIKKLNAIAGVEIKYLGCIETFNANGDQVLPHLHLVISGASAADIKKAWIYGNVHSTRIFEKHIDRIVNYMSKGFQFSGEKVHRYIRSRNLTPPDVEIRKFDTRESDNAAEAEEIAADPVSYCNAIFPDYEIVEDPVIYLSEYLAGFYLRIELQKKVKKSRKRRKIVFSDP